MPHRRSPRSSRRTRLAAALVAVAALAGGLLTAPAAAAAWEGSADDTVVKISDGRLQGTAHEGYRTFEGIPFAAPPVGELRWRAPQSVEKWKGVLDATVPRTQCAQLAGGTGNPTTLDEDCLYLNVTTAAQRRTPGPGKPVMVWIHGGSFLTGTGGNYDASKLAVDGDVVVVTINYRLGPLGFLAQAGLSAEDPEMGSGSYALLDQQAALTWVKHNIRAFGGDPHNVTVFGESAGAASVCANMVSPTANKLFDRAIAQSYSCTAPFTPLPEAEAVGQSVADEVGCGDAADIAECLRGVDTAALLEAWPGGGMVVGGAALPTQARQAFLDGTANPVDVLHGNTLDENRLFIPLTYGPALTAEQYAGAVAAAFGPAAPAVLDLYPVDAYPAPIIALSTIFSDANSALATCDHVDAYEAMSAQDDTRVYAYQFQDRTADPLIPVLGTMNGAAHATELPYLFPGLFGDGLTAEQHVLSDAMVAYWTSFAGDGVPSADGAPDWPPYSGPGDVLGLDVASAGGTQTDDVAAASHCGFWTSPAS